MARETIAVDLDDVLAATNERVAEMHNECYGTNMTLKDFRHCERYVGPGIVASFWR